MANEDKPQRNRSKAGEAPRTKMKAALTERPFDLWLQKQLHAMYDEITNEPLPNDLLDLIETDARRKKKGKPGNK
jgi:hypothetical protein